jgi:hypothetical protein
MRLVKIQNNGYSRRDAKVRIAKKGTICFSECFAKKVKIDNHTRVSFFQDAEQPKNWYVFFDDNEGEALRYTNGQKTLMMNIKKIVDRIYSSVGIFENSVSFRMATSPTEVDGKKYYAILTNSNK